MQSKTSLILHYSLSIIPYSIYPPFIGETAFSENIFNIPDSYLFALGFQDSLRLASILSISSKATLSPLIPTNCNILFSISISIKSFSSTNAIGPPTAASGETCPIAGPLDAPENLPSVIRAILADNSLSDEIASVV